MRDLKFEIDLPRHFQNDREGFMAIFLLQEVINTCLLQMDRIEKDILEEARHSTFSDIHFFLVALSNTNKLLFRIKQLRMFDRDLIKIYKKYLKKLNQFDVFRDHLEHISERLGGKNKKNEPMKDPKDFGNLNGKVYTFGGDNFDLEEAYTLVRNLISDIKSWEPIKNLPQI